MAICVALSLAPSLSYAQTMRGAETSAKPANDVDTFLTGALNLLRAAKARKDAEDRKKAAEKAQSADQVAVDQTADQQPVVTKPDATKHFTKKPHVARHRVVARKPVVVRAVPVLPLVVPKQKPVAEPVVLGPAMPPPAAKPAPLPPVSMTTAKVPTLPQSPGFPWRMAFLIGALIALLAGATYAVRRLLTPPALPPKAVAFADAGTVAAPVFNQPDGPALSFMIGAPHFAATTDYPGT